MQGIVPAVPHISRHDRRALHRIHDEKAWARSGDDRVRERLGAVEARFRDIADAFGFGVPQWLDEPCGYKVRKNKLFFLRHYVVDFPEARERSACEDEGAGPIFRQLANPTPVL